MTAKEGFAVFAISGGDSMGLPDGLLRSRVAKPELRCLRYLLLNPRCVSVTSVVKRIGD